MQALLGTHAICLQKHILQAFLIYGHTIRSDGDDNGVIFKLLKLLTFLPCVFSKTDLYKLLKEALRSSNAGLFSTNEPDP